ncbi:MAG: competence/damage-inducible protein A [Nocardioides sp.]|nr:competence/damage-inducible protein A [Nocardioides sp.]
MSSRARVGMVVTGTEVLTGRVRDANGPWVADTLRALGVEIGAVVVVGDRPDDLRSALAWLSAEHDLVLTSGGLGPTADDLTAAVVAEHQGRPTRLDEDLAQRVQAVFNRFAVARGWRLDPEATRAGVLKQATVPDGATVLAPVGTAPGLVVPVAEGRTGPPVVVLPGPPSELRGMWDDALTAAPVRAVLDRARPLRQETVRLFGTPESELAASLRRHETAYGSLDDAGLEVTTCLTEEGELEIVTRFSPDDAAAYDDLLATVRADFADTLFAEDATTLDQRVADALRAAGATVATAESCTAGMLASRLADLPGSSDYLVGGFVVYANDVKRDQVGVPQEVLDEHGAVSPEVARLLADGARTRLGTTYGVGITGVAGPGGGSAEKPVGLVHVCVTTDDGRVVAEELRLAGTRTRIRRRTVVAVLHHLLDLAG